MAAKSTSAEEKAKSFACSLCNFTVDYHYHGKKPPFAKSVMLLEDCYVMKDPFSTSGGLINLGGKCSYCNAMVCMSSDCSLFYTKRFCLTCVLNHLEQFPTEIQQEVGRRRQEDNQ